MIIITIIKNNHSLELGNMGGNINLNTFLINLISMFSILISGPLVLKYKPNKVLSVSLFLTGLFLFFFIIAPIYINESPYLFV